MVICKKVWGNQRRDILSVKLGIIRRELTMEILQSFCFFLSSIAGISVFSELILLQFILFSRLNNEYNAVCVI